MRGNGRAVAAPTEIVDLLARAERLELKSRFLAASRYAGLYQSAFRGQGMEFSEVREYAEGDDIRLIDWNVTARSQALHVKKMVEERERNVLLVLDTSGSLAFGSVRRTKFDLATELAAVLILSAFFSRDRVSLACFSSKVDLFVPAAKGGTHAARLIREMSARQPLGACEGMDPVWSFLNSPGVPRSLTFLLTDFQAPLIPGSAFAVSCRKHELVVILVSDPREWRLPRVGRMRFSDPETGQSRLLNTNATDLAAKFERVAFAKRASVLSLITGNGADCAEFSTGTDYETDLRRFLETRGAKRGYRRP
jgi:uncharacterized protein (DUF58 family)